MGLSWQQGPLGRNPNGRFLVPGMPERVLYAEPLRRRMRAERDGRFVVDSEDAVLLFEPGRYPVAYFPVRDFAVEKTDLVDVKIIAIDETWSGLKLMVRRSAR